MTTAGLQFGTLIGQTVIVEKLFSWPGLGSLLVDSIFQRDIPVTQGCILTDHLWSFWSSIGRSTSSMP